MQLRVDPNSTVPPSQQLVAAVLDAIARGELRPGDKLPAYLLTLPEEYRHALVVDAGQGASWAEAH